MAKHDKKPKRKKQRREPRLPERGLFAPADVTRATLPSERSNAPGLMDLAGGILKQTAAGVGRTIARGVSGGQLFPHSEAEVAAMRDIFSTDPAIDSYTDEEIAAGFAPGTGELLDLRDVVRGVRAGSPGRTGLALASLALPFVTLRGGKRLRASSERAAEEAQRIIDAGRHAPAIKDPFTGEPIVTGMSHDLEDLPIGMQDYYRTAPQSEVAGGQGFVHQETGPTLLSRDETAARTKAAKGESSEVAQAETEAASAQPLPLLGDGQTAAMRGLNIPDVSFSQVDPKEFSSAVNKAGDTKKGDVKLKDMLTIYSPEEYAEMRTFLSPDGKTGYAIKSDGDLVSVFNVGGRGAGSAAVLSGIEQGATKLDAFEPFLPDLYNKLGFEPVRAEGNWTPGGPPVTYMKLRDEIAANPQLARERVGSYGEYKAPTPVQDFENMIVDARKASESRADAALKDPKLFAEAREQVKANLLPHELESLTPKQLDKVTENFLRAPEPRSTASLIMGGAAGAEWYDPVADALYNMFGEDAPRFASLMAALSPQADVKSNLDWALKAWERWQQLGRPGKEITEEQLIDIVQSSGAFFRAGGKKGGTYHNNLRSVFGKTDDELLDLTTIELAVPQGKDAILTGPKVDPFYANLIGETQRVVQDTHMAQGFGTTALDIGTKTRNLASTAALRAAGKEVEALTGVAFEPRQLQAAYWTAIKSMRDAARGPGLEALARSELQRTGGQWGETVFGQAVKDVPSFQTMLHEDPARQILERLGVKEPPPAPALPQHGFDPSLIRPQDLIEHGQRSDLAKLAAQAQKEAREAARGTGVRTPMRDAREWGYLYGVAAPVAAPAVVRRARGLLEPDEEDERRRQSPFNLTRPPLWQ